jgi:hypothetical protein
VSTPRKLTAEERAKKEYGTLPAEVAVTDDARLNGYNCFGFAVGLRWPLKPPQADSNGLMDYGNNAGPEYLTRWGYTRVDEPSDTPGMVALFQRVDVEPWHVAKHLRDGWYESKCGEGLRIVHRLWDIARLYGEIHSYWVRDESAAGLKARDEAKEEEMEQALIFDQAKLAPDSFMPVEDSAGILNQVLRVVGL